MSYTARVSGFESEYGPLEPENLLAELLPGRTMWEWSTRAGDRVPIYIESTGNDRQYRAYILGEVLEITVEDDADRRHSLLLRETASGRTRIAVLRAPMPGLLKQVLVREGDRVERGDPLCILEAMKMENELRSPGEFIVGTISAEEGTPLEKGVAILRLEPIDSEQAAS